MKLCILGDTHFGIHNDNVFFQEYQYNFFKNILIPYLLRNNINEVIHLGDLFDRRKYINFLSLNLGKKVIDMFISNGIFIHLIVGNHDSYYKSDGSITSSKLIFDHYEYDGRMKIYDKPEHVIIAGKTFLMVPWIYPSKMEETIEIIKSSTAEVCCGHFEMNGVPYQGDVISKSGLKKSLFSHFDTVFSGHFHKPSEYYVGSPYQTTWAGYEDKKRIAIYDTESRKTEYKHLSDPIYKIIVYDGSDVDISDDELSNKIIKVIVNNKDNPYHYEKFVEKIELCEPSKITIKNEYLYLDSIVDENVSNKDTLTILLEYVDDIPDIRKGDSIVLKEILSKIYNRAKSK
jgi:DNA repair exonuclease SbcCD nuclease subunit